MDRQSITIKFSTNISPPTKEKTAFPPVPPIVKRQGNQGKNGNHKM